MQSIEERFAEVCEALRKAKKFNKFREVCPIGTNIESQVHWAEGVLDGSVQQREAAGRTIPKYNGAAHNGYEEFRESGSSQEAGKPLIRGNDGGPILESDRLMVESLTHPTEHRKLTEAEKRKLLGQPPAEYDNFTEAQKRNFDFARAIGISEADALKLSGMTMIGRDI